MPPKKPKTKLEVEKFHGTVILQNGQATIDTARFCRGYTGICTLIPADQIVKGQNLTGKDANWMVRVEGSRAAFNVPGCQIHAVVAHDAGLPIDPDFYVVP